MVPAIQSVVSPDRGRAQMNITDRGDCMEEETLVIGRTAGFDKRIRARSAIVNRGSTPIED